MSLASSLVEPKDEDESGYHNEYKFDDARNAERMSATPLQFVYPAFFRCIHRLGCCRHRTFDKQASLQELSHTFQNELICDMYLKRMGVNVAEPASKEVEIEI